MGGKNHIVQAAKFAVCGEGLDLKGLERCTCDLRIFSASVKAASSAVPPRAVLMKYAPGFIQANCYAPSICRVSALSVVCILTVAFAQHLFMAHQPDPMRRLVRPHASAGPQQVRAPAC
jgi:hypothetical protein